MYQRQLALTVFIVSSLCRGTVTQSITQTFAQKNANLSDVRFTDNVIKASDAAKSKIHCARACLDAPDTKAFTFRWIRKEAIDGSPRAARCRCHSSVMQSDSPHTSAQGTEYYEFISDKPGLDKPCKHSSNCSALVGGMCFSGKCLCHPNDFYSVSQKKCVTNCSDQSLGSEWLKYPNSSSINYHHSRHLTLHACKSYCRLSLSGCQAVDVNVTMTSPQNCVIQHVPSGTPGQTSLNWHFSVNRTLHKRTCL